MPTSTLRHSALKAVFFFTPFLLSVLAQNAHSAPENPARFVTKVDKSTLDGIRRQAVELVQKDELFPQGVSPKISLDLRNSRAIESNLGRFVIAPAVIKFGGITNSYCRILVHNRDTASTILVPTPLDADPVTCQTNVLIADSDINSDGYPDFIFRIRFMSNRYADHVYENRVYLSQPNANQPYCFSREASLAASSASNSKALEVEQSIRTELARRGKTTFDCQ